MAAQQQQQWDAPLQHLLSQRVIDGYALVSHPGECLASFGALAVDGEEPALGQLHSLFHSPCEL